MVTTLDRARDIRAAENGKAPLPSCENGRPEVRGRWWLFGW